MSSEVFRWQPNLASSSNSTKYNTLISQFENGMTQRRNRFGREIGTWKFTYQMALISSTAMLRLQDSIIAFFKARKGSYDNFYLPSWEYECRYVERDGTNRIITVTTTTEGVSGDMTKLGFSTTLGAQGNYVCVCDKWGGNAEVRRITALGTNSITVDTALTGTYGTTALVMKAYKVYFESDELERSWNTPFAWDKEITFIEDIGGS